MVASRPCVSYGARVTGAGSTLAAAVLGFFVITLDAVVVNVALPSIQHDLGGGITGLAWVLDGYTLMFAALLLSAGALSDRIGARRAFAPGVVVFVVASAACGLAASLGALIVARFVQGAAAAVMMPSSMALIGQARARIAERLDARVLITGGLVGMTAGLVILAVLSASTPVWVLAVLMALVGLAGPLVMPPVTAVLLNSVPGHRAGTASGVFNTSRQIGGALAVAVFGALLAQPGPFLQGLRTSLLLAAAVGLAAAASTLLLKPPRTTHKVEADTAVAAAAAADIGPAADNAARQEAAAR
ncbi:MAG: MFS transporter [Actinobacteria bacterium]|nr:MFS transporter [Actinomycetota bacterium]